jgi:PPOX class probable F420-dependent enzyme
MHADRPDAPGYDFVGPDEGDGLLPFEWVVEQLQASHNLWLVTTFPDGRPHAMPVWGVWAEERVQLSTGRASRKARNLERDPRCVVTTDDGRKAVVVEGTAARVAMSDAFVAAYDAKYAMDIRSMADEPVFAVTPTRIIAIDESRFATAPTRWRLT